LNWDAIGAIGEIVGAIAVVLSLIFLGIQMRQNTRAMEERNKLERSAALDRHTDSVSRWRSELARNQQLTEIWYRAIKDEVLTEQEAAQVNNIFINFINTQRSNFERAKVVGEAGLMQQTARSVAVEVGDSKTMTKLWNISKAWHKLASPDYTEAIDEEIRKFNSPTERFEQSNWKQIFGVLTGNERD